MLRRIAARQHLAEQHRSVESYRPGGWVSRQDFGMNFPLRTIHYTRRPVGDHAFIGVAAGFRAASRVPEIRADIVWTTRPTRLWDRPGKIGSSCVGLPGRTQSAAGGVGIGPDGFLARKSGLELDVVGNRQLISGNTGAGAGT